LPYASAPFVLRAVSAHGQTALRTLLALDAIASTASHPASVTIAKRPSLGWDGRINSDDLPDGQSGLFFAVELDNPNQLEMSQKFNLCEHGGESRNGATVPPCRHDVFAQSVPLTRRTARTTSVRRATFARIQRVVGGTARPDLPSVAIIQQFLSRQRQATDVATLVDQNRSDRRVFAQQCRMAGCGAVSMGATDDPVRMRNGMIQINAAARLPPKEFAQ